MERKEYTYKEKKDTRSGFGDGLYEIGKKNKNVVAYFGNVCPNLMNNTICLMIVHRIID